jgi:hypothetical protein
MESKFNIKDRIDKITCWIDQRNLSISMMIGMATVIWIIANMYFNDLTAVGSSVIKQTANQLGMMGLWCAIAAFSYYVVREAYVYGRKKSTFLRQQQSFFNFSILVLRRLHIWFGVLAVTFMLDHGYLLWVVRNHSAVDRPLQTSLLGAVLLCVLACLGILVRIYPAATKFRLTHRLVAFLVFFGYLLHIAAMRSS